MCEAHMLDTFSLAGVELRKRNKGLGHLVMRGSHKKRLNLSMVIKMKKKMR